MLKLTRGFTSGLPCRLPRGVGRGKAHTTERFGRYERLAPPSLREGVGHIPRVALPPHIPLPPYGKTGEPPTWPDAIPILGEAEAERMRKAGALAKATLQYARSLVAPGITTADIDARVHAFIIDHGAYPSPLNYMGFPKSICTSISNVLCHGIPDTRSLCSGDLINIDITVYLDGFHGDTSATIPVGEVDEEGLCLIRFTEEALAAAIAVCGPGTPFTEIGRAVAKVAKAGGYSINEEFSGHGIGQDFHSLPLIYHHENDEPGTMEAGMAFTIEPMLCQGTPRSMTWPDGWTMATTDGGRSAQAEHTLLITQDSLEILTA